MISSNDPNLKAEEYKAQEVPLKVIEKMIRDGTWKDSLEEEEVVYNLENNLYSKEYAADVKKLLNL